MSPYPRLYRPKSTSRVLKVVIVGDSGVGKTACVRRFIHDTFPTRHRSSIGITVHEKQLSDLLNLPTPRDEDVTIQVWDMNSQRYHTSMRREFYLKTSGVIFVADVTDEQSFHELSYWLREVQERIQFTSGTLRKILFLNKIDLLKNNATMDETMQSLIPKALRTLTHLCSAKDNVGIHEGFMKLVFPLVSRNVTTTTNEDDVTAITWKTQACMTKQIISSPSSEPRKKA